ncbi:myb-like protein X [Vespula squamosa]|uniref:Myb-like protein X n=1 Tax=Vespula squamosa TaxID=30214 RepID=A0ABD1ZSY8_VESSQ
MGLTQADTNLLENGKEEEKGEDDVEDEGTNWEPMRVYDSSDDGSLLNLLKDNNRRSRGKFNSNRNDVDAWRIIDSANLDWNSEILKTMGSRNGVNRTTDTDNNDNMEITENNIANRKDYERRKRSSIDSGMSSKKTKMKRNLLLLKIMTLSHML